MILSRRTKTAARLRRYCQFRQGPTKDAPLVFLMLSILFHFLACSCGARTNSHCRVFKNVRTTLFRIKKMLLVKSTATRTHACGCGARALTIGGLANRTRNLCRIKKTYARVRREALVVYFLGLERNAYLSIHFASSGKVKNKHPGFEK